MSEADPLRSAHEDATRGTNPQFDEQAQRELEAEIRSEDLGFGEDSEINDEIPGFSPAPDGHPTLGQPPLGRTSPATRRRGLLANADPLSIGAGLVFFVIGGAYLLASGGHLSVNAGWTLSMLLVGLGLSGVISALIRFRRGSSRARR